MKSKVAIQPSWLQKVTVSPFAMSPISDLIFSDFIRTHGGSVVLLSYLGLLNVCNESHSPDNEAPDKEAEK